jgi:hypothetical protein
MRSQLSNLYNQIWMPLKYYTRNWSKKVMEFSMLILDNDDDDDTDEDEQGIAVMVEECASE